MADITESQRSDIARLTNGAETNIADINSILELSVNDTPQQGVSAILALTTTAVILKVGASPLANRKSIEMQALTKNVKWGYNAACEFDLFKNQFFALPAGENCSIYLKVSTGTGSIAIGEK